MKWRAIQCVVRAVPVFLGLCHTVEVLLSINLVWLVQMLKGGGRSEVYRQVEYSQGAPSECDFGEFEC